jgi:adenylylsulfate kinase
MNNVIWHDGFVKKSDRNALTKHNSGFVLFTGLSASGKSTIAHNVEKRLFEKAVLSYVLDGDNIRHGLNSNLTFSPEDRKENLRRVVEVSKLFIDAGIIVLAAFISPHKQDREHVRQQIGDNFIEIYVKCSVEECEKRDPKGQYQKARAGIIKNYTGISSPYDVPDNPDLIIDSEKESLEESVNSVLDLFDKRKFLSTV